MFPDDLSRKFNVRAVRSAEGASAASTFIPFTEPSPSRCHVYGLESRQEGEEEHSLSSWINLVKMKVKAACLMPFHNKKQKKNQEGVELKI